LLIPRLSGVLLLLVSDIVVCHKMRVLGAVALHMLTSFIFRQLSRSFLVLVHDILFCDMLLRGMVVVHYI